MKNVFLNLLSGPSSLSTCLSRFVVLCFVVITFSGCSKEEGVPADVIAQQKMVSIITDVHELEAKISFLKLDYDSSIALYNEKQALVFEKHGVTYPEYNKSFDFYLSRTDLMNKIYEAVVDSLSLRRNIESSAKQEENEDPI